MLHVKKEMEEGRKNRGKGREKEKEEEDGEEIINVLGYSLGSRLGQYISYFLKESWVVLTYTVTENHWKLA